MKYFEKLMYLPIILIILIIQLRMVNMAAVMSVDLGSEWMKASTLQLISAVYLKSIFKFFIRLELFRQAFQWK